MAFFINDRSENKKTHQAPAINIASSDLDLLRYLANLASPLIEVISDVIFYIRTDGIIAYISPAISRFGYKIEDVLGREFTQLIYPEDIPAFETALSHVFKGDTVSHQNRHLDRNGGVHAVRVYLQPIFAEGCVVGACGVVNESSLSYHFEKILQRRAAQLSVLNAIGAELLSNLELAKVLKSAVTLLQKSFGYFHVAVFIVDNQKKEAVQAAIAGTVKDIFPENHSLKFNQGMVGEVCVNHQILLANNVLHEPHYVNLFPDRIPTRSELSLPIMVGDELVGVLDIQSPTLNAFDEQDVRTLEAVTHQIAIAIKNARLFEEAQLRINERERAEKLMRLQRDLLTELTSTRNLDRALNLILRTLIRIDGITGGAIYRIDPKTGENKLAAHIGLPEEPSQSQKSALPVNYQSIPIAQLVAFSNNTAELSEEAQTTLETIASLIGAVIARLEAELALAESESKHRALVDALPDLMFLLDRNGVFVDFKPGPNENFYVTPQVFLGKTIAEIMPPQIANQAVHFLDLAFESGLPQIFNYELTYPNEREIRIYEARIVRASSNFAVIISREITELKRTEIQRIHSLELEQTINRVSTRFIDYANIDKVTDELLRDSAQALRVEIAYVYRFTDQFSKAVLDFHWVDPSLPEVHRSAEDFDNRIPTSWFDNLQDNQPIAFPGMMPDDAVLGPYLTDRHIQALLIMPFFLKGELAGFIGFANVTRSHDWLSEELTFTRNLAEILARAVERHYARQELDLHLRELEQANKLLVGLDAHSIDRVTDISEEMRGPLKLLIVDLEALENSTSCELSVAEKPHFDQIIGCSRKLLSLIDQMLNATPKNDSD